MRLVTHDDERPQDLRLKHFARNTNGTSFLLISLFRPHTLRACWYNEVLLLGVEVEEYFGYVHDRGHATLNMMMRVASVAFRASSNQWMGTL